MDITQICSASPTWLARHGGDTPEQAMLRQCLIAALKDLSDIDRIRVGGELVDFMRDELMGVTASVRKLAAVEARKTMEPHEIALAAGVSGTTVARLLVRGNRRKRAEPEEVLTDTPT